jgi:hypothetical protein
VVAALVYFVNDVATFEQRYINSATFASSHGLQLYRNFLFVQTKPENLTVFPACPSGQTPTETNECEACPENHYSLGVQSECLPCSAEAEY